ncbi:MAG TPA: MFS transporter, partial [Deltaproteobacteria bacterium]|nr:MFS transporter [Deltaproteobacteria bacterium]
MAGPGRDRSPFCPTPFGRIREGLPSLVRGRDRPRTPSRVEYEPHRTRRLKMTRTMFLLGTGWFGFQAFWAFHAGPLPLFLKDFTDSKFTISLVLSLAGLSGCVMPPLAGYWSDRVQGRFGRRRPFVLAGSLVAAACVLVLPEVGRFAWVGLLAGCMYFAIRVAETPYLSLLPDLT